MGHLTKYVDRLNNRWKTGRMDYDTWLKCQNKLVEWHNRSLGR